MSKAMGRMAALILILVAALGIALAANASVAVAAAEDDASPAYTVRQTQVIDTFYKFDNGLYAIYPVNPTYKTLYYEFGFKVASEEVLASWWGTIGTSVGTWYHIRYHYDIW